MCVTYFVVCATKVSKGISANLMKMTAKRRRSKLQIKEEKKKEEREKDALAEKLKELTELK